MARLLSLFPLLPVQQLMVQSLWLEQLFGHVSASQGCVADSPIFNKPGLWNTDTMWFITNVKLEVVHAHCMIMISSVKCCFYFIFELLLPQINQSVSLTPHHQNNHWLEFWGRVNRLSDQWQAEGRPFRLVAQKWHASALNRKPIPSPSIPVHLSVH